MADPRRFGIMTPQFDIESLVREAQHRWLRPVEICEILRNYQNFRIAPEPPNRPPSGSLFLFDRKVLRYFRRDSHTWRKKKDGKTVKEAHERLKAEGVDVLHCYYAHGEENENFQRRTYWMLEEAFMHIVLVHYLEIKGNKASYSRRDAGPIDSPSYSGSFTTENQLSTQTMDAGSPSSAQMSEYEDAESDNHQARSGYHPVAEFQQYDNGPMKEVRLVDSRVTAPFHINNFSHQRLQAETPKSDFFPASHVDNAGISYDTSLGLTFDGPRTQFDLASWDEVLEPYTTGFQSAFQPPHGIDVAALCNIDKQQVTSVGEVCTDELSMMQNDFASTQGKDGPQLFNANLGSLLTSDLNGDFPIEGFNNYHRLSKQSSLDFLNIEGGGLKKHDSFSRWMSKELGEVDDSHIKPSFGSYWNSAADGNIIEDSTISNPDHLDAYIMAPSVSKDQLFSIIDFSPNWAPTGSETKVLVTGLFLKDKYLENYKWSCMFGEVEVPAEVLGVGILRCYAPALKAGRVPFYITCSNRLACSEVREFEYRAIDEQDLQNYVSDVGQPDELHLQTRLEKLLCSGLDDHSMSASSITDEKLRSINKISSLLKVADDEWFDMLKLTQVKGVSPESTQDQLLQNLLKEKLHNWLVSKIVEEGKGPNVWDKEGQGVLHLAAALGYDWAIKPTITAGVSINFRDIRGWTALHWAAFAGREHTVISFISLGADPGLLTDPTPEFPSGRTPADLASGNGHKGIAGFLAESSLNSHLSALTLKDKGGFNIPEVSGVEDVDNIDEHDEFEPGGTQDSLKDSLSAVRNASLAAARIYQVYRVHSFQRKKLVEYDAVKSGISDERAISLISIKPVKSGQRDTPIQAAAIKIQNKFRGWKGRKDFLITRQRIVKIQAHVRGHQVRKRYKKIVWTVSIVEKVILRWRRRGSGLRGFRSEGLIEDPTMQTEPDKEDDYDFLQEGKRQTEARLDKALARVKSMVHYPEARDQYRRLMTAMQERNLIESEEAAMDSDDFMMELEGIWEDDPLMPTTTT